ncbi:hypothetical protein KP003_02410 [Geomonas nitrogeniifigens]|uniref:Uncharacterized protein n=1 Tax=Geomonas diazotrophica TaxID=2843197 RepID=A0ABX8JKY4_9BACT|nr:hypothetical protein [Geomonas nitrogeniifigens]QWV98147.1 hypothetical protein KP005_02310 [Geomonas nitrogeniifigens]QXE87278.1 hypothetical protein KP003_02410 [Geomonas nitrogeniifigens]
MAEIFFIASDERALDLIESLRIQSPKSLTFETDLPSAIRRLPKEHPHYVFIQSSLDGIPGEEIATQARALIADPSVQLVLLEEDESSGRSPAGFVRSFSLNLPTARLSEEVMQLLTTETISGAPSSAPADLSDLSDLADLPDLFTLDDTAEFEIPDFDDAGFEPHLAPLWPDQPEAVTEKGAALDQPAAKEFEALHSEEIGFFVSEPSSLRLSQQEPAPTAPVIPGTPVARVAPEAQKEPAQAVPEVPTAQEPPQTGKAAPPPRKPLYPTPDQIYRKPPELCGDAPEEGDAAPVSGAVTGSNRRNLASVAVLGIVVALGVVFWQRSKPEPVPPTPRPAPAPAAVAPAPPAPAPAPATEQAESKLPGFVPKVPADAAYAAAHPGWELYRGDRKQFRIYREQGKVRAIQVLAEGDGDLNENLPGSFFKEATGGDLPGKAGAREQDGLAIETRKAKDGAEIAIYREKANRRIRGLVLQLPDKGQK